MSVSTADEDLRYLALRNWLAACLGTDKFELAPASADASFRRYFRVRQAGNTWIAMDAPPEREDCHAFVSVAALLREAGLHAPAIHARDTDNGFLLLEDLGDRSYLDAFRNGDDADALFADAVAALVAWQSATHDGALPDYDEAELHRELTLFPEWFLGRHLGVSLTGAEEADLAAVFDALVSRACAQPRVFVHRDYMPRNLMVASPNPGIIDFQDARLGPATYDAVSLFRDAFVSWPPARVARWVADYRAAARTHGVPLTEDDREFAIDFDWMGVQRHLKVLGIFARIRYRDGKPWYLDDAPRFVDYILPVARRHSELEPLARLFERYVTPSAEVG